jgi:hypothetical protein
MCMDEYSASITFSIKLKSSYTKSQTVDKIKLSLCLIRHHSMKTYGGLEV